MERRERREQAVGLIVCLCLLAIGMTIATCDRPRAQETKPSVGFATLVDDITAFGVEAMDALGSAAEVEVACALLTPQECTKRFPNACSNYTRRFDALEGRIKGLRKKAANPTFSALERTLLEQALVPADEFVQATRQALVNMRCLEA